MEPLATFFNGRCFVIDSLINVQQGPGDTLHATAVGSFNLHGVTTPMQAPVRAWRDPAGFRVQASFDFDAQDSPGPRRSSGRRRPKDPGTGSAPEPARSTAPEPR